jgi:hypothetical protein
MTTAQLTKSNLKNKPAFGNTYIASTIQDTQDYSKKIKHNSNFDILELGGSLGKYITKPLSEKQIKASISKNFKPQVDF